MERPEVTDVLELSLLGNHLALDLVNTVDWRLAPDRPDHVDLLTDDEVLLHWGHRVGLLNESELRTAVAELAPGSTAARDRTITLRETLYGIFARVAGREPPDDNDLKDLRAAFSDAVAHGQLRSSDDGALAWSWDDADPCERVRWAVAASAVDLLTSGEVARVKQCLDSGCGWLFVDMSKNASRRWCSMQGCGARAKMRRQYRRKKTETTTDQAAR
jgi:predicted RNA-binding Zn ribbon-like protein